MSLLFLVTLTAGFSIQGVSGSANDVYSPPVSVERKIDILNGGYIMINDTFFFPSNIQLPSFYMVGLSRDYHENLVYLLAHDAHGILQIEVYEEDNIFKWFKIHLGANEDGEQSYNFTLTAVFSDLIRRKEGYMFIFRAEFPLYPVLRGEADLCNVILKLPSNAEVLPNGFPEGIFLNMTSNFRLLNNLTRPLPAYINLSSWVEFLDTTFSIFKILKMRRDILVDGWGRICATDYYEVEIINVNSFYAILPPNSTNILVYDMYERCSSNNVLIEDRGEYGVFVNVFLSDKLKSSEKARIAITYSLPYWKYIEKSGWQKYTLSIDMTRPKEWIIPRIVVSILLPEGASIIEEPWFSSAKYERINPFQERVTFEYYNLTMYENPILPPIKYQYSFLWAAFRPTILAMALIGLVSVIVIFIKPSSKIMPTTKFSLETLRGFIQAYEDGEQILLKLESLREEYMRGRIPKRQYQLMRKMFEEELHKTQGKLTELKAKIESAGGRYAEAVRRLERVNANIDSARRGIEEADIRLHRGEISVEEHRRLIKKYTQRIEKAKTIIEEIILGFREETWSKF